MKVVPYKEHETSKKEQVARMFDNISGTYDFLNHLLSLGIDIIWRKNAINKLKPVKPRYILDIATGTGDLAMHAMKLKPEKITGIDISKKMLDVGRKKLKRKKLEDQIELRLGDSERLDFKDNKFDAVIVAFGVRNFDNLETGIKEMYRVLRTGGMVVVLEFSKPYKFPMKQLYNFYFKAILPKIGKLVSRDNAAYTYLPESVQAFPDGDNFLAVLRSVGFKKTECDYQTFGISAIYTGVK